MIPSAMRRGWLYSPGDGGSGGNDEIKAMETAIAEQQKKLDEARKKAEASKTYTAAELQSEVDRRVQEALKTSSEKLLEKFKTEQAAALEKERQDLRRKELESQGKFEEASKLEREENARLKRERDALALQNRTSEILDAAGLTAFRPLFAGDLSTPEGVAKSVEALKGIVETSVKTKVEDLVRAALKGDPPPGGKPAENKPPINPQTGTPQWEYPSMKKPA